LSEEKIVDVDDFHDANGNILTEAAASALADAAIASAEARSRSPTRPKVKVRVKTPTKAKPRAKPALTSSPTCETPVSFDKETTNPTVTSSAETDLDAQMELAITLYKAPPSTNHQKEPTWHEKILLYDPIVLEDLATWLNTVGLAEIGEDREVSALEVREWCEKRGVCCLWRGGWRGNKAVKE